MTIAVIAMCLRGPATAAMLKGISLALVGVVVLGMTCYRVFAFGVPSEITIGVIGLMTLAANAISVMSLWLYKEGDSNVCSVQPCSRNDAVGNIVILAAVAVGVAQARWPDLAVATVMVGLFLHSSTLIIRQAREELGRVKRHANAER